MGPSGELHLSNKSSEKGLGITTALLIGIHQVTISGEFATKTNQIGKVFFGFSM